MQKINLLHYWKTYVKINQVYKLIKDYKMETFIGVKLIKAEPAKGHNNKLYTSASAAGVKTQEGYKVVYEDGYESWSPKEVFEKAYRKTRIVSDLSIDINSLGEHQVMVVEEAKLLERNIRKLTDFIEGNVNFASLGIEGQTRLKSQLLAMRYYLTILVERIENFK